MSTTLPSQNISRLSVGKIVFNKNEAACIILHVAELHLTSLAKGGCHFYVQTYGFYSKKNKSFFVTEDEFFSYHRAL